MEEQRHLQSSPTFDVEIRVLFYLHPEVSIANERHGIAFVWERRLMADVDVKLECRVVERSEAFVHASGNGIWGE